MIQGGKGGAKTSTGIVFEKETDLTNAFTSIPGVTVSPKDGIVTYQGARVGVLGPKSNLYSRILKTVEKDGKKILSKRLLPDEAYFSEASNTLIILEKKYQQVEGSVDEKLQTCDFKLKQYKRLSLANGIKKVEYVYVLGDWFTNPKYEDVLAYIKEVGCKYYFRVVPPEVFGFAESEA